VSGGPEDRECTSASVGASTSTSARLLLDASRALEPHSAIRYAPALLEDLQIALFVSIDVLAAQLIGRWTRGGGEDDGDGSAAAANTSSSSSAAAAFVPLDPSLPLPLDSLQQPQAVLSPADRTSARRGWLQRLPRLCLPSTPTDPLPLPRTVLSTSSRQERRKTRHHRNATTRSLSPPPTKAVTTHTHTAPHSRYRTAPVPTLTEASVACALIDAVCGGTPVQTYLVATADGYLLTLIRLPRPASSRAVLFQHGLLDSASAWVSTGNVFGLAARAYAAGHDVFLGNLRGTNDALGGGAAGGKGANPGDWEEGGTGGGGGGGGGDAQPTSPLRGRWARAHVLGGGPAGAAAGFVHASDSATGIPVHESLPPSSSAFWSFDVFDHALDVMAFVGQIRAIKAVEEEERAYLATVPARSQQRTTGSPSPPASPAPGADPLPPSRAPGADALSHRLVEATTRASVRIATAPHAGPVDGHRRVLSRRSGPSSPPPPATASATATAPLSLVAIGHSMGGAVLLQYVLACNALGRPHHLERLVLLSPAGLHRDVPFPTRLAVSAAASVASTLSYRPFPSRTAGIVHRAAAQLLQDARRSQATADLIATAAAAVLGGLPHLFVFRSVVPLTQYPLGGTSTRVILHGVQCMRKEDWTPFDYGPRENARRYGSPGPPPSFRPDLALLNLPVRILAGGRDLLIPPANLVAQAYVMNALRPGTARLTVFPDLGHLDFTLGVSDAVVDEVLEVLRRVRGEGDEDIAPSSPAAAPHGSLHATDEDAVRRGQERLAAGVYEGLGSGTRPWAPASVRALDFPWLRGWTHFERVFKALDEEALTGLRWI
jgi:alpha-beta hydrolase superfamily lysophospholipase